MTAPLRRALLRPPHPSSSERWSEFGWRSRPDPGALGAEHEAFAAILADAGVDVGLGVPSDADPDAVYAYDPVLVMNRGAILLRPGKVGRRSEVALVRADLEAREVPIAAALA